MDFPKSSFFFMEEDTEIPAGSKPLMLEAVLSCPILKWMSSQLLADGVQRFFVVCSPRFAEEARNCFPADADVTVSEQQTDLMAFLNTPDQTMVFVRGAIPFKAAGQGFVYAAPGYELQEAWKVKMTNAVPGATLMSGWLPVYGPETIAELEPAMREMGMKPAEI
jgi:bifunctional UDP-N-acetylglucosamine pyrophosphorylase/glucosamine-1-phosphate N-acetyltransferase